MNRKQKQGKKEHGLLSNVVFLCRFAWKVEKPFFFWKLLFILVQAASPFIPIFFLRKILDQIITGVESSKIIQLIIGMAVCVFIAKSLSALIGIPCNVRGEMVTRKLIHQLGLSAADMAYFNLENPHIRDTLENAQSVFVISEILNTFSSAVQQTITMLGMLGIIIRLQPLLLAVVAAVAFLKLFADRKNRKVWEIWRPKYASVMRRLHYITRVISTAEYAKENQLHNLFSWLSDKVDNATKDYMEVGIQHNKAIRKNRIPGEIAVIIQEVLLYLYLAWQVVISNITIGDFSMYQQTIKQFSDNLIGVAGSIAQLLLQGQFVREFRLCVELAQCNIKHIAKCNTKQQDGEAEKLEKPISDCVIRFEHVTFQYPGANVPTLKDINLEILPGTSLSIVGHNGAGKTTFVKLLCRFYVPTSGRITVNGLDIQLLPYEQYSKLLGVVFQDFQLFAFSIEDNIFLHMQKQEERLADAILKSGMEERISKLDKKTETMVSREFDEQGVSFSGGERQKIALARAIYQDAPVLILDEPTSALDPLAEYDLYQGFHQMTIGKTAIYISHRLSSTRFTDDIAVFDQGNVVEFGKHDDLILQDGLYARMFHMQADSYQSKEKTILWKN